MSSTLITYSLVTRKQTFGCLGLGFGSKVGQMMPVSQGCEPEISDGVLCAL